MSNHGLSDKPLSSAQLAHQQQHDSTSSHPASTSPDPTVLSTQDGSQGRLPTSTTASASQQSIALRSKLQKALRQYQDFPSPGILFEDIMPIFADPQLHESLLQALELHILEKYSGVNKPDVIVGLEARGFLFGPSLALRIGAAFVPVRKKGKLPGETETTSYKKEYGEDFFQMQRDAIKPGQKVIVVDDIIATGGSAMAAGQLIEKLGGHLLSYLFLLELDFLKGRDKLNAPVYTLLSSQE